MNITIDRDACKGCGECAKVCPAVFGVADGRAVVVANPVPADAESDCRRAMYMCPEAAISEGVPNAFMMRKVADAAQWVAI